MAGRPVAGVERPRRPDECRRRRVTARGAGAGGGGRITASAGRERWRLGAELQLFALQAELGQAADLDLADALPGDAEPTADLLERLGVFAVEAVAELEDGALAPGQVAQQAADVVAAKLLDDRMVGAGALLVLDEVTEGGVVLLTGGSLERDGVLAELH